MRKAAMESVSAETAARASLLPCKHQAFVTQRAAARWAAG